MTWRVLSFRGRRAHLVDPAAVLGMGARAACGAWGIVADGEAERCARCEAARRAEDAPF